MTGTICCEFIRRTSEEKSSSLVSFPIQAGPILSGGVTTEMIIPIRLAEKRIHRDCRSGLFLTVMTGYCRLAPREYLCFPRIASGEIAIRHLVSWHMAPKQNCIARENDASDAMPSRFVKDHSMLIVKQANLT